MFHSDEIGNENGAENGAELPELGKAVVADLVSYRREYEQLEGEHEHALVTHNDAVYRLAARIVGRASRLQDHVAWQAFIDSPDWLDRKRPKPRDQAKAVRHAVRFVLPPRALRQVRSYWTISLEQLIAEGYPRLTSPLL